MPLRRLAPAGTPIDLGMLAAWMTALPGSGDAAAELARAVCARQGVHHCTPIVTGRAGLLVILRALATLAPPERRRVVVPSYTCYTVAASVIHAGLSPLVVDISPDTLDFDRAALERVDFRDVLAIVPTNLYGLPSDLPYLASLARAHGVRLVDDAAQSFGAAIGGRQSGTWGDAGLYSLDKGKNITTIDGGLAVTNDPDLAAAIDAEAARLAPRSAAAVGKDAIKLVAYAVLLRPWLYWVPSALPGVGLGVTYFPNEIPLERYAGALAAMGLVMLPRLEALNRVRRGIGEAIDRAVTGVPGVARVRLPVGAEPVYLRYPLLAASRETRDALLAAFAARGIGATGSYPSALVDVPEIAARSGTAPGDCPNGRAVAERILTLPTHPYVTPRDVDAIAEVLRAPRGVASTPLRAPA